jgi:hypothetical protein
MAASYFFFGAGTSYPAGLPSFAGLVERLYKNLSLPPSAIERAAIKSRQYDTAVGLLEGRIVGGREKVREQLTHILTPDLSRPRAVATHEALLTLARSRKGQCRLITTNFDRLFEEVIKRSGGSVSTFHAPLLPVPKNRWDGLVYLHGLLPETSTQSVLDRLVISSGDFGLAYLTERWAARFVSDLFRNYRICFVGYSINDPVLRYMMDALAADRLLGESPPEVFAFGSCSRGREEEAANEWKAKNVTPILYRVNRTHSYLHRTLHTWADTYRDGISAKERIVAEHATLKPLASTQQDDFIGRVLWALGDSSGLPAKRFAELVPPPSLDWLEPLAERRFAHGDLRRFGVEPNAQEDTKLAFSLIARPAPYLRAPWMTVSEHRDRFSEWDDVMFQLARWLLRHLGEPRLILWFVERGETLHPKLEAMVASEIDRNPPSPPMQTLWRLALSGRLRGQRGGFKLHTWRERFVRNGPTPSLRLELCELLKPHVQLGSPFGWPSEEMEDNDTDTPRRIKDLVNWEIVLATDDVHAALKDLGQNAHWHKALPHLLSDSTGLSRDALDLMRELGGADDRYDTSYAVQPSIKDHPQNRDFHEWTALIVLTRDAWLATAEIFPDQARAEAWRWLTFPYPLFRRLAFFAAAETRLFSPQGTLTWLLSDNHWWLWSTETQRETLRLLVAFATQVTAEQGSILEQAILRGPPNDMFQSEADPKLLRRVVDHEIWLRLTKYKTAGASMGPEAAIRLDALSSQYPDWRVEDDEKDEFPVWMGDGGDWRTFQATPKQRRDLVIWLREHAKSDIW